MAKSWDSATTMLSAASGSYMKAPSPVGGPKWSVVLNYFNRSVCQVEVTRDQIHGDQGGHQERLVA